MASATRVREPEALCAELYQVLGTVGAPVAVLDKVPAAASGPRATSHDRRVTALLAPRRAVLLGQAGGQRTSQVKIAAARANGRKGGRPRKATTR